MRERERERERERDRDGEWREGTLPVWRPRHHDVEGEISKKEMVCKLPFIKSWVLQSTPQGCLSDSE